MNIRESIKRVLKEIEEDRVQIRLGRSADRHFGKVQNIIIKVDDDDITSQDDVPGLGKMNIVIKDDEIIVGDIFIPEKYRRQGIATVVYQKISDYFGLPIVSSKTKGFNQTMEGGYIWKDREKFEPRNLQESIRRLLREETENTGLKDKLLQVIKSKGIKRASKVVGGIKNLSKIFNLEPHEIITDFFQNNIMSTRDDLVIDYSGSYDFKFKLVYVEKVGDAHLFFYKVSDGSVELFNGEIYDLSGDEIRKEKFFWWEIQQEISDILYRYTNNLIKDLNMEGDILVDYTLF